MRNPASEWLMDDTQGFLQLQGELQALSREEISQDKLVEKLIGAKLTQVGVPNTARNTANNTKTNNTSFVRATPNKVTTDTPCTTVV